MKRKFGGFAPPDAPVIGAKKKPVAEVPAPPSSEPQDAITETQEPQGGDN